jgi:calcineurin-like phosphoesterase family protein
MIWFTADLHLDHEAILSFQGRPFKTLDDMNKALVDNWNRVVAPGDEVWLLGDFVWSAHVHYWRKQLQGHINLVLGNHDRRRLSLLDSRLFTSVQDVRYLRWQGERFWLSHYAHRVWPKSGSGAYHLYGHSHGDLPMGPGRSMDVGVDANDYTPISIERVVELLRDQPMTMHHRERGEREED